MGRLPSRPEDNGRRNCHHGGKKTFLLPSCTISGRRGTHLVPATRRETQKGMRFCGKSPSENLQSSTLANRRRYIENAFPLRTGSAWTAFISRHLRAGSDRSTGACGAAQETTVLSAGAVRSPQRGCCRCATGTQPLRQPLDERTAVFQTLDTPYASSAGYAIRFQRWIRRGSAMPGPSHNAGSPVCVLVAC